MEPTIIELSEVAIEGSRYGKPLIRISQDADLVVVENEDIEEFVAAARKHAGIVEELEPAPEKWYVVLKNSNDRLTTPPGVPIMFTTHLDARIYARGHGGLERTYCPISADEYERVFGR